MMSGRVCFFNRHPHIRKHYEQSTFFIRRNILPLLYPNRCPLCQSLLPRGSFLCPSCRPSLPLVTGPVCFCCGKPVVSPEQEYCNDCLRFPKSFRSGCSLLIYNETTRPMMAAFKYQNRRCLSLFFASELFHSYYALFSRWQIQAVIPVPVHKNRKKKRGYNQAALLARDLACLLCLPYYPDFLIRKKDTLPQKNFHPARRLYNLSRAFAVNPDFLPLAAKLTSVLLIDDIYTTGATAESCSRLLLEAGIKQVYLSSVCIGTSEE